MLNDTQAYKTSWGLKTPGATRGKLLHKLADLIEANLDEFAALEALNGGMWLAFGIKEISLTQKHQSEFFLLKGFGDETLQQITIGPFIYNKNTSNQALHFILAQRLIECNGMIAFNILVKE